MKCVHNIRKYICIICSPNNFCTCEKIQNQCKIHHITNSFICIHDDYKHYCKICSPHNYCEHNRLKKRCKECGTGLCSHDKHKDYCPQCSSCPHNKRKSRYRICSPDKICQHDILYENCNECGVDHTCEHNLRRSRCNICSPNNKSLCTSSRLFHVLKKNNYLCSYCNPIKPLYTKTRENRVKQLLEENNFKFICNKQFTNDCCIKNRPDFLFDCGTYFLVLDTIKNVK
jgi:hypothetical protein